MMPSSHGLVTGHWNQRISGKWEEDAGRAEICWIWWG